MAALLHQGPASVLVEAVPVPHLLEKGVAVLAHRHHPYCPQLAAMRHGDRTGDRRHVAVLEAHPDERGRRIRRGEDAATVLHGGAERLLDETADLCGEDVAQHGGVGHGGGGDHDGIAASGFEQRHVIGVGGDRGIAQRGLGVGDRSDMRIGDGDDPGIVDGLKVPDVLEAHHPGPDDPDAQGVALRHGSILAGAGD